MKLSLLKIEEGLCEGMPLYHSYSKDAQIRHSTTNIYSHNKCRAAGPLNHIPSVPAP